MFCVHTTPSGKDMGGSSEVERPKAVDELDLEDQCQGQAGMVSEEMYTLGVAVEGV